MSLLISIVISFYAPVAHGQDIFDELDSIRDEKIKKLILEKKESQKRRYTETELFTLKVTLEDITKSQLKNSYIEKGAMLISLEDDEIKYTPKGLNVRAYSQTDKFGFRYIVDKEGAPKFKVAFENITNIEEITDLYRKPEKFYRLQKKAPINKYDDKFNYSLLFNLHTGITLTQFTNSILGDAESYAPLLRLELGTYTNFDLPVDTGFSLVYETIKGNLKKSAGSFNVKAISLGPNFRKKQIFGEYDLILQPRLAVISNLVEKRDNAETTTHKMSDTSLLLAIEKDYKNFSIGYSFQRKWLKPSAGSSGLNFSLNAKADDSFGIYIGRGTDLTW